MDETTKKLNSIYRGQIANRILLIIVMLLLIGNLTGTIILGVQFKKFTVMLEPAVEVISQLDVEALNNTLVTLSSAIDVFKINDALDTISKIDFDGFSDVISGIDVDKLNSTLEKIDEATKFMKRIGDGMNSFLNQFGINLNNN